MFLFILRLGTVLVYLGFKCRHLCVRAARTFSTSKNTIWLAFAVDSFIFIWFWKILFGFKILIAPKTDNRLHMLSLTYIIAKYFVSTDTPFDLGSYTLLPNKARINSNFTKFRARVKWTMYVRSPLTILTLRKINNSISLDEKLLPNNTLKSVSFHFNIASA